MKVVNWLITMPRSGSHAIARWLISQRPNCPANPRIKFDNKKSSVAISSDRLAAYVNNEKGLQTFLTGDYGSVEYLTIRVERLPLVELHEVLGKYSFEAPTNRFLLLRSMCNWMVSRNVKRRGHNLKDFEVERYKKYCEEAIKGTFPLLSYDEWESSVDYRKSLCHQNGLHFTDIQKDNYASLGGIFMKTDGTLERWRQIIEDPRQKKLLKNLDDHAILNQEKLFGPLPDEIKNAL